MQLTPGTIGVSSGKWYWEGYVVSKTGDTSYFGVVNSSFNFSQDIENVNPACTYRSDGGKRLNGTGSSYGNSYTTGDIIGIALNLDDNEVKFYKNNTVQDSGTAISITADTYLPIVGRGSQTSTWVFNFGQDSSFAGNKTAQGNQDGNGKGDFYYEPPSGCLALCTDNLSTPEIKLPGENFNSILYTGSGSSQALTGVGFSPDVVWVKNRSNPGTHQHMFYDTVRGVTDYLVPDATDAEATDANSLTAFGSDGFTLGSGASSNGTSATYVAWNWKAGGTAVSNSEGSVTSSVSANPTVGFSVCSFTMGAGSTTIGHGLSQAPELIIFKATGATDGWYTQWPKTGNAARVMLNETAAQYTGSSSWSSTSPTATVFTASINHSNPSIAYCFHSVEGYSKVGSYTGNASADGTFVYCGFRPAFLIAKNYGASGKPWVMYDDKRDTYNEMYKQLLANDTAAENTSEGRLDFVGNGFKWRIGDSYHNDGSFIYIAFAESPFKYSNAR